MSTTWRASACPSPPPRGSTTSICARSAGRVIAVASDRADVAQAHVALFTLDTSTRRLVPMGRYPGRPRRGIRHVPVDAREGQGAVRLRRAEGRPHRSGAHRRVGPLPRGDDGAQHEARHAGRRLRRRRSHGQLYVAEETSACGASPRIPPPPRPPPRSRASTARRSSPMPRASHSPQGTHRRLSDRLQPGRQCLYGLSPARRHLRRPLPHRSDGGAIDGTSDTDGIELALGDFGPAYRQGLFVAQDGDNAPDTQNFKYVSWAKVKAALGL